MTCIAGVVKNKKVYIGADSLSSNFFSKHSEKYAKVFRKSIPNGESILIGGTSSWRMLQLLEFELNCPDSKRITTFRYLVKHFVPAIRKVFKEHGYSNIDKNEESGGFFLVGFRGRLFTVQSNFSVLESSENIDACGCGEAFARGAMLALPGLEPKARIRRAITIASQCSAGVGGKIRILEG